MTRAEILACLKLGVPVYWRGRRAWGQLTGLEAENRRTKLVVNSQNGHCGLNVKQLAWHLENKPQNFSTTSPYEQSL